MKMPIELVSDFYNKFYEFIINKFPYIHFMKVVQFTIPMFEGNSIHVQEDHFPYFYEHLHRHTEAQVTHIIKGEGTLFAGNMMHQFGTGDIFVIGANQPHVFKCDSTYFKKGINLNTHSLNIYFNPEGFLTTLLDFPEMSTIKKFISSSIHGMQASKENQILLAGKIKNVVHNTHGYRLSAFIEMLQTMSTLKDWKYLSSQYFENTITDYEGLRMNDIYQYTMANYSEEISLEEIASIIHLTPQSFCRYFKKHTLKTYTSFLNEVRINEACKKIITSDFTSISAIAYHTGFNNVSTFNRVFKSIIGKPPRSYMNDLHSPKK